MIKKGEDIFSRIRKMKVMASNQMSSQKLKIQDTLFNKKPVTDAVDVPSFRYLANRQEGDPEMFQEGNPLLKKNNGEGKKNDLDNSVNSSRKLVQFCSLPVVIMPKYKNPNKPQSKEKLHSGEFEYGLPEEIFDSVYLDNKQHYTTLGHDSVTQLGVKHYRLSIGQNLESSDSFFHVDDMPHSTIKKGKAINVKSGFFSSEEEQKSVGIFKGNALILDKKLIAQLSHLGMDAELLDLGIPASQKIWFNSNAEVDLLKVIDTHVVVYCIDAKINESFDTLSENDCYLILKLGEEVINDSKNVIQDKMNPSFNRSFQ